MKHLIARGKKLSIRVEVRGQRIRFYNSEGVVLGAVNSILEANIWLHGYEASEAELSGIINYES